MCQVNTRRLSVVIVLDEASALNGLPPVKLMPVEERGSSAAIMCSGSLCQTNDVIFGANGVCYHMFELLLID